MHVKENGNSKLHTACLYLYEVSRKRKNYREKVYQWLLGDESGNWLEAGREEIFGAVDMFGDWTMG